MDNPTVVRVMPAETRVRVIELFMDGQDQHSIRQHMDFEYTIDEVNEAIREMCRAARVRIPPPIVDDELPVPLSLEQFKALVRGGCTICSSEGHEHTHDEPIIVHSRCHLSEPMWVLFDPKLDLIVLLCQACGRQVARFKPI